MLKLLGKAMTSDVQVLVMTDRGLSAAWLFEAIVANGWHPFLRVKQNLTFRATGEPHFAPIRQRVSKAGKRWKGQGAWSESGVRQKGTLLVRWEKGSDDAINVVTDLLPNQAQAAWYQMRFWIEDDYTDGTRGWFHGEHRKMTKPERAGRLWLVLGLALSKAILLGSELEAQEQAQARRKGRGAPSRRRGRPLLPDRRPRGREQRALMRGVLAIRAAESGWRPFPFQGRLLAQPLPAHLYPVCKTPRSYQRKKQCREEKRRSQQRQAHRPKGSKRAMERAAGRVQREEQLQQRGAIQAEVRACRQQKQALWQAQREAGMTHKLERQVPEDLDRFHPFVASFSPAALLPNKASDLHPEPSEVLVGDCSPLLRLSRGCLIRSSRLLGSENRHKADHGPVQEASP